LSAVIEIADHGHRPSVAIVAHEIHDAGGMERVFAELVRRIHPEWRVVLIASEVAVDLRPLVDWRRVRVPRRPFPLRFLMFFVLVGSVRSVRLIVPVGVASGV
jgi:hypothetical protein